VYNKKIIYWMLGIAVLFVIAFNMQSIKEVMETGRKSFTEEEKAIEVLEKEKKEKENVEKYFNEVMISGVETREIENKEKLYIIKFIKDGVEKVIYADEEDYEIAKNNVGKRLEEVLNVGGKK